MGQREDYQVSIPLLSHERADVKALLGDASLQRGPVWQSLWPAGVLNPAAVTTALQLNLGGQQVPRALTVVGSKQELDHHFSKAGSLQVSKAVANARPFMERGQVSKIKYQTVGRIKFQDRDYVIEGKPAILVGQAAWCDIKVPMSNVSKEHFQVFQDEVCINTCCLV